MNTVRMLAAALVLGVISAVCGYAVEVPADRNSGTVTGGSLIKAAPPVSDGEVICYGRDLDECENDQYGPYCYWSETGCTNRPGFKGPGEKMSSVEPVPVKKVVCQGLDMSDCRYYDNYCYWSAWGCKDLRGYDKPEGDSGDASGTASRREDAGFAAAGGNKTEKCFCAGLDSSACAVHSAVCWWDGSYGSGSCNCR